MHISDLEAGLFEAFPAEDAETWDHVGLSVGRPRDEVRGIACALDVTCANIDEAHARGANVLLTHHPIYLKAPDLFAPAEPTRLAASGALYRAIELGMSVISLHTNLDRSRQARDLLPDMVGFAPFTSFEFPEEPERAGLGALADGPEIPLGQLARRCATAFGTDPRVWGPADAGVSRIATCGGAGLSADDVAVAVRHGVDAVITGEAGYHVCQDALLRGVHVILLGHDRSEEPFVNILKDAAAAICPNVPIATIVRPTQWWTLTKGECS